MDDDTAGEWMAEARAWAASFPQRDYIVDDSRESFYRDDDQVAVARSEPRQGGWGDARGQRGSNHPGKRQRPQDGPGAVPGGGA